MSDPLLTPEPVKPGIPVKKTTLIAIGLSVLVAAFFFALLTDTSSPTPQDAIQRKAAESGAPKEDAGSKVVIDEEIRKAKEAVAEAERKEMIARGETPAKQQSAVAAGIPGSPSAQPGAAPAAGAPTSPLPDSVRRRNQDVALYEDTFKRAKGDDGSKAPGQKSDAEMRREREHESDYQGRVSRSAAFDDGASVFTQQAAAGTPGASGAPALNMPQIAQPNLSRIPQVQPVVSEPASASRQGSLDRINAALQGQGGLGGVGGARPVASGGNTGWLNDYAGSGQARSNEVIKSYPTGSRFTLHQGKSIPAVLGRDINSQLPGEITAYVTSDVYDSLGNGFLLIPKGAVLVGRYNSEVKMGQERVMFAFQRIILPDGTSFDLPAAQGMDVGGASGVEGDVNNHFFKMFASSFFTAWLADRVQPQTTTQGYGGTTTQVSPAGQVLVDVSRTILDRNKAIQPTITVPKGTRINIEVKKDMEFAGPYNRSRN